MAFSLEALRVPPLIVKVFVLATREVPNTTSAVIGEQLAVLSKVILPLVIWNAPPDREGPDEEGLLQTKGRVELLLLVTVAPEMVNVAPPPADIVTAFCTVLPELKVIFSPTAKIFLLINVPAPLARTKEEVPVASPTGPIKVKDPALTVVVKD
jgi:hypothetical protein